MFKKFFGKKNDGFYLQIEDDNAAPKPAAKAKAKPEAVATPASTVVVATETTATVPATVPVTAPAAKADKKVAKTDKKSPKKAESPKVVETPAPVAPVATAPAITNFATDYLIKPSSISSRRRPGANMSGFLELARQVKKPVAFKASASERKAKAE